MGIMFGIGARRDRFDRGFSPSAAECRWFVCASASATSCWITAQARRVLREQTQENVADGQLWSLDRLFDKTGIPDNEVTMKRQVFKSLLDKMVAEGILKKQGELYQEGKRSHHA